MLRVALIGEGMCTWDGGLDFLINIAKIVSSDENIKCILVLPQYSPAIANLKKIFHKDIKSEADRISKVKEIIFTRCPEITVKFYNKIPRKMERYRGERLDKFFIQEEIDIALPVLGDTFPYMKTPWIGYIPDLQEHHFPDFFSDKEIKDRNHIRTKQLELSRYILLTSNTVKNDIYKYFKNIKSELFIMPFAPIAAEEYIDTSDVDVLCYKLPKRYFLISNQFWIHKSHMTAFEALKLLHSSEEYQDVHIICTGRMDDYRNREYSRQLLESVSQIQMQDYIHFLGYIPKRDQIEIMKRSSALVQPTLLEGDPGGCSTYDAVSIGVRCILSDIPVNIEAKGTPGVSFFKVQDAESLKNEMIRVLCDKRPKVSPEFIRKRIIHNSAILCTFYREMLETVRDDYYN